MASPSSPDDKPQPVSPRFSLLALLGVVTVCGVILAAFTQVGTVSLALLPCVGGICLVCLGLFGRRRVWQEWGLGLIFFGCCAGALVPVFPYPHQAARRSQCSNNLRQLALGLHSYHDRYDSLPERYRTLADGTPNLSWRVTILPWLEEQSLFDAFALDELWNSAHNWTLKDRRPITLYCPSSTGKYSDETDYFAIGGQSGCWPDGRGVKFSEVSDGASNTLLLVESHDTRAIWSQPKDLDAATMPWTINGAQGAGLSSKHPGGAQAALADGSVRFLSKDIDPEVVKQLANGYDGMPGTGWEQ